MLLSKLGGSEASQGEKASLLTELDLLRQENATLTDAISSGEKQCDCLEQEIGTLRTAAQTAQTELASKIAELASLNKELLNVKDANNVQRADMDRELSRLEGELRKADDQARVMQLDLMERTHAEARLKGELSSADSRCAQLEADNMALRRRLLDTGDDRDREVSQLQNRVMCLETELRNVMSVLHQAMCAVVEKWTITNGLYGVALCGQK
ncbi:unnamed protein product [Symbiodinium microadriaticum]|nr:unnamed protein product [Symbiodinium microadriaticum]